MPDKLPRVLSRTGARRAGLSKAAIEHRLAIGRWQRVLPHTYLTSDTLTWADQLQAALVFAGPGSALSGAAALCDRGVASVRRPQRVLVLAAPGSGPHSIDWVRIRRTDRPFGRALVPGPARACDARSVADLAVELHDQDAVRALVADTVRKRLCTPDELRRELEGGPRRGSKLLRQAVDEIGAGAWSAPEARAASLLRSAGITGFEQNAVIALPGGRHYVADFLWRELNAVLEIDSYEFHSLPGDADRTSDRHVLLETLGFSVVHRTPTFVRQHPERFLHEIRAWLAALAARLRS